MAANKGTKKTKAKKEKEKKGNQRGGEEGGGSTVYLYFEISFPSSFPPGRFLEAGIPLLGCFDLGGGDGEGLSCTCTEGYVWLAPLFIFL